MAYTKFNLNVAAFEASTRNVMQPGHISMLPVEYQHFPQYFLPPHVDAESDEDEKRAPHVSDYSQVLNCVMTEDGLRKLATFRDCEHYRMQDNSEESEVPEDDSDIDDEEELLAEHNLDADQETHTSE